MDRFPDLPEGENNVDRMIQGLRRKAPLLNALCSEVLIRAHVNSDANLVPRLVSEAALPGKQPDHRVRILNVIQRIGEPLAPDDFFTMMGLTGHRVEKVARKATEVIIRLRPTEYAHRSVSTSGIE